MATKKTRKLTRAVPSPASAGSAILRDAARYRFLRSLASRDHKGHTTRALEVEIQDWGKNLGRKTSPFWSSMPVTENAMDRAVDAAMRNSPNAEVSESARKSPTP